MHSIHKRQDDRKAIPDKTEVINHVRFAALRSSSFSDIPITGAGVVFGVAETKECNL